MRGQVRGYLPHVGQIFTKRVRQNGTPGPNVCPRLLPFALLFGKALICELRHGRRDAVGNPFVSLGVTLFLMTVQRRRLFPIPTDRCVPPQRDSAKACEVGVGLSEQRQPTA